MLYNVTGKYEKLICGIIRMISESEEEIEGAVFVLKRVGESGYGYRFLRTNCADLFAIGGYLIHKGGEQALEDKYPDILTDTDETDEDEPD